MTEDDEIVEAMTRAMFDDRTCTDFLNTHAVTQVFNDQRAYWISLAVPAFRAYRERMVVL